jgi:hypothetical protein
MGGRWSRVSAISPVSRIDVFVGDDPWAEFNAPAEHGAPVRVVVRRVDLRALYAPSPEEVASWPLLPDGGVVTEIRKRS